MDMVVMNRIIMHIDVNNAFLSWTAIELLNKGYKYDIRNSYAVIGGDPSKRSGIVLAKSTPAKKMGVVTGETLYSAKKKCPSLRSYPSNYRFYSEMSKKFIDIIKKYTPDLEQMSIDECFIDYTSVKKLYGNEIEFAKKLQKEIFDTLGFTVNIGIANNKLCAKMASDFSKPNKIHTCYSDEVKKKMWPLPVGELFGVGRKTSEKLINLGIKTIGDLANADIVFLRKYFKNMAGVMIEKANGIDNSLVDNTDYEQKGIGNEITLDHDVISKTELYNYLLALAEHVSVRLRRSNKYAGVVVVVLKDKFFKRRSHQKKLVNATNNTDEIYKTAKNILDEMYPIEAVRLIGLRLDNLLSTYNHQVSMFEDITINEANRELDKVLDQLKSKYGSKIVKKASLIDYHIGKDVDK